jgi:hypothetical protein
LDWFKPTARAHSLGTTWDPATKQITSTLDANFTDTLIQDPLYDLTNSYAALLSSDTNFASNNAILIDVPNNDGSPLGFYRDTDSISTFRSAVKSVLKRKKDRVSVNTPPTALWTPTQSVSFAPAAYSQKADDTSISRMSDTASKVAGLETRFEQMESQFSSSFARLEAILSGIGNHSLTAVNTSSSGSNNKPMDLLAITL